MTIAQRPEFKAFCARMKEESFRKRAGMIFTRALTDDVTGFVGLNSATQGYPKSCGVLHPIIGVHHIQIQQECAHLIGTKYHPYNPLTVTTPLYLAMGLKHSSRWVITPDGAEAAAVFDDLFEALVTDGLRWMQSHLGIQEMLEGIREVYTPGREFTLPVLWRHAGRPEEAQQALQALRDRVAGSTLQPTVEEFVARFNDELAADYGADFSEGGGRP